MVAPRLRSYLNSCSGLDDVLLTLHPQIQLSLCGTQESVLFLDFKKVFMYVFVSTRRERWVPQSCSYMGAAKHGCWEPNAGPLEDVHILLAISPGPGIGILTIPVLEFQ